MISAPDVSSRQRIRATEKRPRV